jgi:hypothetical protein
MPIDAIVTLDRLDCFAEHDESGHSEPYIWPLLLRIDDHTLATPALIGSLGLADEFARVVVKSEMKRGDSAPIPAGQRGFSLRFDDNLGMNHVIVVVVLMEQDDLPDRAATAGYIALRTELPRALADLELLLRLASDDAAVHDAAVQAVVAQVTPLVKTAISDKLSATEKLKLLLGLLDLDDQLAVAVVRFDRLLGDAGATLDQVFTMRFVRRNSSSEASITDLYRLQGRFQTRRVTADRCQPLLDRVRAAQQQVDAFLAEIAELKNEFKGPELKALIDCIQRDDLDPATAALDAAKRALAQCRARSSLGGVVGPISTASA